MMDRPGLAGLVLLGALSLSPRAWGQTAQVAQAPAMRIDEAVQLASSRNERAEVAARNVEVSAAAVERARAAFLPVLGVNASDTERPRPTAARVGVASNPTNIGAGTLSLNQPLLNASAFPLYAQARNNLDAQKAQSTDDRRQLAFDAARAFFDVLSAEQVREAAQRRLDSAVANLNDTQARVESQLVSSNDATRAEIDRATAARQLEAERGSVESAYLNLGFTLNSPPPAALEPPEPLLQAAAKAVNVKDDLVRFALVHRPDVSAKRFAALAAHDFASEPLLRLVPSVGLNGQVQGTTNVPTGGRWDDEVLSVNATWTIYDAGLRYADKKSRAASARIADLTTQTLLRTVEAQVKSALAVLAASQAALSSAEQAVAAARQSAEETGILYKQGLAKAIELVDANTSRFSAEVEYANARYSMAEAYLALRQSLGLDPLGTEIQ